MKKLSITSKNNFIKKILIKLIRKIGYEVIDQSIMFSPTKNKYYENNFSEINKKNIVLPIGEIKITRKVKSLLIIFRSFTNEDNQLSVRKKRIFECEKKEYTLRALNSLCKSISIAQKRFQNLKFFLKIIDDNSKPNIKENLKNIVDIYKLNFEITNLNVEKYRDKQKFSNNNRMIAHNAHIFASKEYAKKADYDLIYFVEDDYLHLNNSISEMILTFEKFSTIFKEDIILCPSDYPYLYQQSYKSLILIGEKNHWRSVDQTLCTYLISNKTLINYWDYYYEMMTNNHSPYEKNLHEIYKKSVCFSPIPSLSIHLANLNTIYGLSPLTNWKKIWEENKYD